MSAGCLCLVATCATGDVNLELRVEQSAFYQCSTVNVGLYAVSDTPGMDEAFRAIDLVLGWDPASLTLLGIDDTGGPGLLNSSFPFPDAYGLNDAAVPADGDAYYLALGQLGGAIDATPEGTLVTTFQFRAAEVITSTTVDILASGGTPTLETRVFGGDGPNQIVTGTLEGADLDIELCPVEFAPPCDELDIFDVLEYLGLFEAEDPRADFASPTGVFDIFDVIAFLGAFEEGCD